MSCGPEGCKIEKIEMEPNYETTLKHFKKMTNRDYHPSWKNYNLKIVENNYDPDIHDPQLTDLEKAEKQYRNCEKAVAISVTIAGLALLVPEEPLKYIAMLAAAGPGSAGYIGIRGAERKISDLKGEENISTPNYTTKIKKNVMDSSNIPTVNSK